MQKRLRKAVEQCRVTSGKGFRLADHDTGDTDGLKLDDEHAGTLLADGVARLSSQQELLYAQREWSLLCVFQAIDAAGKDGTIKHVMSGVNPQGVSVSAFKAPGPEELDHDFLWRVAKRLPERGHIGIFNRSHYEEVLVARIHPEILAHQRLPAEVVTKKIWQQRLADIAAWEDYLARQGTVVLKFFLHISKAEQKKRFIGRMDEPGKNWKFQAGDIEERRYWDEYMSAYQETIRATASKTAPWFVVPADKKWFTRLVVVEAMVEALERLKLTAPQLSAEERLRLAEARRRLEAEE
jgi:PPK2 family polyphosphate:nucleotide phosphotransferase